MKKILVILSFAFLVSGCSMVTIENQSFDEILHSVIQEDFKLENVSLEGYSYYLPKGVLLKRSSSLNSELYYNHQKMYLYVDVYSYYHQIDFTYEVNEDSYYSQGINLYGKKGYLEITQVSTNYFVEFMYNYAKIEAYVDEEDLKKTVTQMAYILSSVDFKDTILDTLVGENELDYNEENFNIFKPTREEGDFLDYEEQYDSGEDQIIDEDNIDLELGREDQ
ncbi:MAG TPA: membrane lipoprotein lipid attachment site-containing protein [Candidatus Scybalousia intestinigallinarum]|nr:membrane lipoprotein lipid attachment site-containing protein [Candidatus Scybalousia intestinigallinarum]